MIAPNVQAALILAIIEALIKYGPRAVTEIAELFKVQDPTPEQIRGLFIDKPAKAYFEEEP